MAPPFLGRLLYYCGINPLPTGGNKITYRHVNLLAQAGWDAWIFHPDDGFGYPGLPGGHRVLTPATYQCRGSDVLVWPEDAGPAMAALAPGLRKIIFNQAVYRTFRHFEEPLTRLPPYRHPEVCGVLVVSEDSRRYFRYAFGDVVCERLWISFDYDDFVFVPWRHKANQIAFLTRKNHADLIQVLKILSVRGRLRDWVFAPVEGLDQSGVASVFGRSRLVLTFGHQEGLCLSNLEALACGCRLIGYSGLAGREYFAPTGSIEIPVGDIVAFCEAVEKFVEESDRKFEENSRCSEAAAAFIRSTYSQKREQNYLVQSLARILSDSGH